MPPTVPDCLGPPSAARRLTGGRSQSEFVSSSAAHTSQFRGHPHEVEQVPLRLDGADVAWFLHRIDGCVEKLRAQEVPDRIPVAVEHVELTAVTDVGDRIILEE